MKYNPQIHKRKSIRLKGYDYSQAGLYFITICLQNRACLFGHIQKNESTGLAEMILNDAGKMIKKWYDELMNKFPDIKCDEMIIMPNHFHCIIENVGANGTNGIVGVIGEDGMDGMDGPVGADLCVCPNPNSILGDNPKLDYNPISGDNPKLDNNTISGEYPKSDDHPISGEYPKSDYHPISGDNLILGEHIGSPLQRVVQWFKTMTTNEYIRGVKTLGWQPFDGKLWQRNYYEHIIRNHQSYHNIANYIINNPAKWHDDIFNK